uniref:Uncharacterized protein n=1 Tax=Mycena chlorophos TaxID=658473 RepID=A0ABQ0M095_MYCCL|nr:predicted protein [Mycena chlorophos]
MEVLSKNRLSMSLPVMVEQLDCDVHGLQGPVEGEDPDEADELEEGWPYYDTEGAGLAFWTPSACTTVASPYRYREYCSSTFCRLPEARACLPFHSLIVSRIFWTSANGMAVVEPLICRVRLGPASKRIGGRGQGAGE